MTRFSKTNRQGQGKSAPFADAPNGYRSASYKLGGFRRPAYQPSTRFGLTDTGRAVAEAFAAERKAQGKGGKP